MAKAKNSVATRRRRKKILKLAKGYFGSKHALYRTANEQVMRSLSYAYRDRKQRKRNFRKLWITRINAASQLNGLKYSRFIYGLSLANVGVNRKVLSDIAIHEPEVFTNYVILAKDAIANPEKYQSNANIAVSKPAKEVKAPAKVEKAPAKAEKTVDPAKEAKALVKEAQALVKEAKELVKESTETIVKNDVALNAASIKEAKVGLSKLLVADLRPVAVEIGLDQASTLRKAELVEGLAKAGYKAA